MNIDSITREAVERCLEYNIPFALYSRPRESEASFVACRPDLGDECRNEWRHDDPSWHGFFINFFGNDESYTAGIRAEMDIRQAIDFAASLEKPLPGSEISLQRESTHPVKYGAIVANMVNTLKKRGGKVVLSRIEVAHSSRTIIDVALDYFLEFPDTFRYLCFTPETGTWFGATPEIVGRFDREGGRFETMAMAGTMPVDDISWDDKNIGEHMMVVSFITDVIKQLGGSVDDMTADEISFGEIKHLVTHISASIGAVDPRRLLCTLSPTPAVAGLPRERATTDIFMNETHSRHCYAGFIGVTDGHHVEAYANLRCAMAENTPDGGSDYNVFSGGGITAGSNPADEWQETVAKARKLMGAINPQAKTEN